MGHRSRRRHGRSHFTGEPNGLQPGDDVGNRRSQKLLAVVPDDIGNRKEPEELMAVVADDLGNRVDLPPTHENSGLLADLDGKRRKKRKGGPLVRLGRYFVGGVNPLVSGLMPPPKPVTTPGETPESGDAGDGLNGHAFAPGRGAFDAVNDEGFDDDGRRKRRRRRRGREGRDGVDGEVAQEISERRAQRFFDFEEDDRFEYILKSDPQVKCEDAARTVRTVLQHAGRDAVVEARLLEDRDRPKVIVTIDDRGPAGSIPEEHRGPAAKEPLFLLGNAALMSLNYLINKIVNRYPDDRIRLAILPKADEPLYLDSLRQYVEQQEQQRGDAASKDASEPPAPAPAATDDASARSGRAPPLRRGRRGGRGHVDADAPPAAADSPSGEVGEVPPAPVEGPPTSAEAAPLSGELSSDAAGPALEPALETAPAKPRAVRKKTVAAGRKTRAPEGASEPLAASEATSAVPVEAPAPAAPEQEDAEAAREAAPPKKRAPTAKKTPRKKVALAEEVVAEDAVAEDAVAAEDEPATPKRASKKAATAKKAPVRKTRGKQTE